MNREKFEALPEIAKLLEEAVFYEEAGEYISYWAYKSGYLNGAYYAFCEQEKRIKELESAMNVLKALLK